MRILVSNDDGIYSPGIASLAEIAAEFGEVRVVAPDVERSSAGHSITASRPLYWKRTPLKVEAYRVDGTPADCVALGASQWKNVDIVLSGINLGSNLGNSIWHSGTVAAAKQAVLLGLRGVALSVATPEGEPDFEELKPSVSEVLKILLFDPEWKLVNVNFPHGPPKGVRFTRQSVRLYDGKVVTAKDPMGRPHFWFTVAPITETEEGTDRWAVNRGYTSITPLRLDLTDTEQLRRAQQRYAPGAAASQEATAGTTSEQVSK
ncbi:MAG: 5'/3'-nucleotidase SurE [Candidatus Binatia bacterium]